MPKCGFKITTEFHLDLYVKSSKIQCYAPINVELEGGGGGIGRAFEHSRDYLFKSLTPGQLFFVHFVYIIPNLEPNFCYVSYASHQCVVDPFCKTPCIN